MNLLSGEHLIALTDYHNGNLPYGICCRFEDLNLHNLFRRGRAFSIQGGLARFSPGGLSVQLGAAEIWQPEPLVIGTDAVDRGGENLAGWLLSLNGAPVSQPHLRWLAESVNGYHTLPANIGVWSTRFAARVMRLTHSVEVADWSSVEEAAVGLLGLGIGLTPSGDDFLAGFLATGLALGPSRAFQHLAHTVAGRARTNTTLVSAALLRALSRGQVGERFGTLLAALDGSPSDLEAAAKNMLEFGSSSGIETMYGLLYGLRTMDRIDLSKSE
ncbi:MAG: DUF2877 domain-containing protein [Anaerolineaceae bacterium]|nr:DUF2877 domain-containing protein [Anaerolineaceae bacterium]